MEQVITNLDPSDDFIAFTEAEEAIRQTATQRDKEAEDVREQFRGRVYYTMQSDFIESVKRHIVFWRQHECLRPDHEQYLLRWSTQRIYNIWRDNRFPWAKLPTRRRIC
jgi:predicted DCC family thiol-disulfide oxidoreductase YuxK